MFERNLQKQIIITKERFVLTTLCQQRSKRKATKILQTEKLDTVAIRLSGTYCLGAKNLITI